VRELLYHHAKFGGARISLAAGVAKNVEFFPAALRAAQTCRYLVYSEADFEVFRRAGATTRDCAPDFAMKALEYKNDIDAVG